MTETVIRHRRVVSGEDRYGNPTYTETVTEIPGALFAPAGADEPVEQGRELATAEPSLYWRNAWPDIIESDRVTVRGRTYDVDGFPADWRGNTVGGLRVKLRIAVEGVL